MEVFESKPAEARSARDESGDVPGVPLRVILVGRTGLDARLRLDPDVELVRVRTRLEAIGELAEPAGARRNGAAERPVVIVGQDGDAGPAPGADADFVDALRRVNPCVRIVAAGADVEAGVGPCDAVVLPDAAADALRHAVHGVPPSPPDGPQSGAAPGAAETRSSSPDEAIIADLLHGRDPTGALLEELRRRVGPGAEFLPGDQPEHPDGVEVAVAGRTLGLLRCPGVAAHRLEPHAAWLGAWIALRDQHAQLREAAFTDPLTGACNRRFVDRFLAAAIEQARRERRTVTVLVFDVDGLKAFNDRFGHAAGDEILRETVRLMRSVTRPSDKVCRIGGDEFAVIFHEPEGPRTATSRPPTDVFQIAGRFQRAVCEARFPKLGAEAPGTLTISGGLASFPWDGRTPEELLNRADQLALESKRQGKNAIRYGPDSERLSDSPE